MANIYYGLNVNKAMNDIGNESSALSNLGLNIENLEIIRGLDTYIDRDEFHTLSGLVDDQRQILSSLNRSAQEASYQALRIPSVEANQVFNYDIESKLIAGSIKYNYTEFTPTAWNRKGADISTSRVSSWSPFGPVDNPDQLIVYNANILNKGEFLSLTDLALTTVPERKRYPAEIATDNLRLMINGDPVDFPVMRGIPFRFTTRRKRMSFYTTMIPIDIGSGNLAATLVRRSLTGDIIQEKTVVPSNSGIANFTNSTSDTIVSTQFYDIYYNPALMLSIRAESHGMTTWPRTVMSNLETANLNGNLYNFIPNLNKYTPNLQNLYLSNNPLYNSDQYSNEDNLNADGTIFDGTIQANIDRIPSSVKRLNLAYSLQGDGRTLDWTRFNFDSLILKNNNRNNPYLELGESFPVLRSPTTRFRFNPQQTVPGLTQSSGTFSTGNEPNPFVNGDIVAYNFHVERDPNLTDPDDTEVLGGVAGSAIGNMNAYNNLSTSDGTNLYEVFIQGTPGNTFRLKTYVPGGSGSLVVPSSTGSGTFHSLVKWNTEKNKPYVESDVGLEDMDTNQTTFKYLPQAILDSEKFHTLFSSYAVNLSGNYENRFIDDSTPANLAKSNEERLLYFNTEIMKSATIKSGATNTIDFGKVGKDTLTSIFIESYPVTWSSSLNYGKFNASQRTYSSDMFDCTALRSIRILRCNGQATYTSQKGGSNFPVFDFSDICRYATQLTSLQMEQNHYMLFEYKNNTFSEGAPSNTLTHTISGQRATPYGVGLFPEDIQANSGRPLYSGLFDHDFFGISGPAGSNKTGGAFIPLRPNYINFKYENISHQAIRFEDDSFGPSDPRSTGLHNMPNTTTLKFDRCTIYGRTPDFSNNAKIQTLEIKNTNVGIGAWSMPPGEVCKAEYAITLDKTSRHQDFTASRMQNGDGGYWDPQELIDMGWSQYKPAPNNSVVTKNSDFVPWGDDTPRGSTPSKNDWFTFNYMTVDNMYEDINYFIVDPTGSSQSQWESLGVPSGITAQKGLVFKANSNALRKSLGSVASGTEYRILRGGSDVRIFPSSPAKYGKQPSDLGAADNNEGTVFTASADGSSTIVTSVGTTQVNAAQYGGAFVEETSPSVASFGTGKVIPVKMRQIFNPGTTWELGNSSGEIVGVNLLKYFRIPYGNYYGNFPVIKQDIYSGRKRMEEIDIRDNNFLGSVPNLNNIHTIKKLYAQNNQFRTHSANTLELATNLNTLDLSNNALEAASAFTIIEDLWQNYLDNNRRNVQVNLTGQNPGYDSAGNEIARCSFDAIYEDPNREDTNSAYNRRKTLIDSQGWEISMDTNKFASQGG